MKDTIKRFFFLNLLFLLQSAWAAEVRVAVTLWPTGSFVAKSTQAKVLAKRKGKKLVVRNATLLLKSLDSGVALRNKHMHEKYFETLKFPEAKLLKAVAKGGKFKGILKVHGVKKKVKGTYEVQEEKHHVKFKTKLSDFKIKEAKYMGVGVEDEVEVEVILSASEVMAGRSVKRGKRKVRKFKRQK